MNKAFRKLINKSLFISVPNSFLKPKSVYGLIYLSFLSSSIIVCIRIDATKYELTNHIVTYAKIHSF